MNYSVTIIDNDQSPLKNQPVALVKGGKVLSEAITNTKGEAIFNINISDPKGLSIRYNSLKP
jgi:hypothetical protein